MILIEKQQEPARLKIYKQLKYAYFDGFSHKADIRKVLLQEQGHICAYCMKRIRQETMTIEHFVTQSGHDDKSALDYRNMLGVCEGNEGQPHEDTTCDEHRGNNLLTVDPYDISKIRKIKYKMDGTIFSDEAAINTDLNETLNLNCDVIGVFLKTNRKVALEAFIKKLSSYKDKGQWNKPFLIRMKESLKIEGKNVEYRGIMDSYIDKLLRRS